MRWVKNIKKIFNKVEDVLYEMEFVVGIGNDDDDGSFESADDTEDASPESIPASQPGKVRGSQIISTFILDFSGFINNAY